jgi:hypothetical protein
LDEASRNVLSQVLSWIRINLTKPAYYKDVVAVVALAAVARKYAKICVQADLSVEPFHVAEALKDKFLLQSYGFLMERGETNAIPYENSIVAVTKEGADIFRRYLIDPCKSQTPRRDICFFYFHYMHVILQLLAGRRQILKVEGHPAWRQQQTEKSIENMLDQTLIFSTGDARDDSAWVVPKPAISVSETLLSCSRPNEVPLQTFFPTLTWPVSLPSLRSQAGHELLVAAMCSAGQAVSWQCEGSAFGTRVRIQSSKSEASMTFHMSRRYSQGPEPNPCLGVMLLGMMPKAPLFTSKKIYNRPSGDDQYFETVPVREASSMQWLRLSSDDERDRTWIEELGYEEILLWDSEFRVGLVSWGAEPACIFVCVARAALGQHLHRAVEFFCEQVFGRKLLVPRRSWLAVAVTKLVDAACDGAKRRRSSSSAMTAALRTERDSVYGGIFPKTDTCAASLAVLLESLLFLPPRPYLPLRRYVNYHHRLLSFQKENLSRSYVWSEELWGQARAQDQQCALKKDGLEYEPGGSWARAGLPTDRSRGSYANAVRKHRVKTELGCLGARHHLDVVYPLKPRHEAEYDSEEERLSEERARLERAGSESEDELMHM